MQTAPHGEVEGHGLESQPGGDLGGGGPLGIGGVGGQDDGRAEAVGHAVAVLVEEEVAEIEQGGQVEGVWGGGGLGGEGEEGEGEEGQQRREEGVKAAPVGEGWRGGGGSWLDGSGWRGGVEPHDGALPFENRGVRGLSDELPGGGDVGSGVGTVAGDADVHRLPTKVLGSDWAPGEHVADGGVRQGSVHSRGGNLRPIRACRCPLICRGGGRAV